MLTLRRRPGETIVIGDNVRVTVVSVNGGGVRLSIDAPGIPVFREELLRSLQQENQRASADSASLERNTQKRMHVRFPNGLFGFADHQEFELLELNDSFRGLISVLDPGLQFWLVDPVQVDPSFPVEQALKAAALPEGPTLLWSIMIRPADGSMPSVNMRAPIVIQEATREGVQVILNDERLAIRRPLFDEPLAQGAGP